MLTRKDFIELAKIIREAKTDSNGNVPPKDVLCIVQTNIRRFCAARNS